MSYLRTFLPWIVFAVLPSGDWQWSALAALLVGFIFSANTVLDWQAVQMWRIEWLLAAVACFVAGILLRQPSAK